MSLDALGAAIQVERVRALRRPVPGAGARRKATATTRVELDEEFERRAATRARAAEIRRTENHSRLAAHHLERVYRFHNLLAEADRRSERVLELADRAVRDRGDDPESLDRRAHRILDGIGLIPGPEGPESPVGPIDLSNPSSALDSVEVLSRFREKLGRSIGRIDRMQRDVLDHVVELADARQRLRGPAEEIPTPEALHERVSQLSRRLVSRPDASLRAQANLPRGLVLNLLRSH